MNISCCADAGFGGNWIVRSLRRNNAEEINKTEVPERTECLFFNRQAGLFPGFDAAVEVVNGLEMLALECG
jgi:hypothetical protein